MEIMERELFPIQDRESAPGRNNQNKGIQADEERLREAVGQFTALLFNQMFKAMRSTIPGDGLFKENFAGQVYQEFFDTEVSRIGAEQNYFKALNQQLYQQLDKKDG